MSPPPEQQLSPELVLILPPEVAAIARLTLPEPGFASPPVARPPARRGLSPRRAAAVAAVYALAAALTVTPLALAMKTVPSHRTPEIGGSGETAVVPQGRAARPLSGVLSRPNTDGY